MMVVVTGIACLLLLVLGVETLSVGLQHVGHLRGLTAALFSPPSKSRELRFQRRFGFGLVLSGTSLTIASVLIWVCWPVAALMALWPLAAVLAVLLGRATGRIAARPY